MESGLRTELKVELNEGVRVHGKESWERLKDNLKICRVPLKFSAEH